MDLGESITTTWEGSGFIRTVENFVGKNLLSVPNGKRTPHTESTYRNLSVLVWIVNDLANSTGTADIVGPTANNAQLNAAEMQTIKAPDASSTASGVPEHSPALLFHTSLPVGDHSMLVETYDGR